MPGRDLELEDLRNRVNCCTVLETAGWKLDATGSTKNAPKYRDGASGIIVVRHQGRAWFDPLGDSRNGDVIALAQHIWRLNIGQARVRLRPLAGIVPTAIPHVFSRTQTEPADVPKEWISARHLRPGSQGWNYLTADRGLPAEILRHVSAAGRLREGIYGTVWASHLDDAGDVIGWEMRGPRYKGFLSGGRKSLFAFGASDPSRVAVAESFIDALSLAVIEEMRPDTRYTSTGGGWTPLASQQLARLIGGGAVLVAGTDRGESGDLLARRLLAIARASWTPFERLVPDAKDWNAQLCKAGVCAAHPKTS